MNSCILIGRLGKDPELKYTPNGMAVCKFSLAVDREMARDKKEQAQAQGQQTADFINITAFNKQAENCAQYLAKGRQAAVKGRIQTGSYTAQDGTKRYTTDVIADRVEFIGGREQSQGGFTPQDEDIFTPADPGEDLPF